MKLIVGKEEDAFEPEVRFWLEERPDSVWLVAKHSRDDSSQNVAALTVSAGGEISIEFRRLFSVHLCRALGIDKGDIISWDAEPAREQEATT